MLLFFSTKEEKKQYTIIKKCEHIQGNHEVYVHCTARIQTFIFIYFVIIFVCSFFLLLLLVYWDFLHLIRRVLTHTVYTLTISPAFSPFTAASFVLFRKFSPLLQLILISKNPISHLVACFSFARRVNSSMIYVHIYEFMVSTFGYTFVEFKLMCIVHTHIHIWCTRRHHQHGPNIHLKNMQMLNRSHTVTFVHEFYEFVLWPKKEHEITLLLNFLLPLTKKKGKHLKHHRDAVKKRKNDIHLIPKLFQLFYLCCSCCWYFYSK